MSDTETAAQALTEEEAGEFWKKVGALRDGLPSGQLEALDAILAGADQAAEDGADEQAAAFGRTLATFRDELPPRQREAFSSMVVAGVAQLGAGGDEVQGYVAPLLFAVGIAAFETGFFLGFEGVRKTRTPKAEAPDLTGIPPSPEEPD